MFSATRQFRKRIISRFAALSLAGFAVLSLATAIKAQRPSIQAIAPGIWVAGIPSNEFEYFAAPQTDGHQRQSNWCWAACVQMVLNYRGVPVTQEQVVQRIFAEAVPNVPGQPDQILTAEDSLRDVLAKIEQDAAPYKVIPIKSDRPSIT